MFFYTKAFFKHTAPRYVLPCKIDNQFYEETKILLSENRDFKFTSDLNFWKSYRYIFLVFLVFIGSSILLTILFLLSHKQSVLIFGILIFIIILTLQPAFYFCILMSYYLKYRVQENKFHSDFKVAVLKSQDFQDFSDAFYIGKYIEQVPLREFIYDRDVNIIKEFVQQHGLISDIAIYKYAKGDHFVILSNNQDLVQFIEGQGNSADLKNDRELRWAIKSGTAIPLDFGNRRLKRLMTS